MNIWVEYWKYDKKSKNTHAQIRELSKWEEPDPKKITSQIEKITNNKQRKINLKSRIKKIKNSEKREDQNELKQLLLKDTLGKINFDSVVIIDFGSFIIVKIFPTL